VGGQAENQLLMETLDDARELADEEGTSAETELSVDENWEVAERRLGSTLGVAGSVSTRPRPVSCWSMTSSSRACGAVAW
jgi:hypothetical protein